ncbi:hypothetical protein PB1_16054 [Bacillus methanolicus PB1]|uniref:Uncharacterized protein n=1 Tax=Bacillus methanolicus PB1 TaxID=997296 RepID=I3DXW5_BACMT|nr:hypothetical protein PB1_16054 [Bacillus methanolicus PB1]
MLAHKGLPHSIGGVWPFTIESAFLFENNVEKLLIKMSNFFAKDGLFYSKVRIHVVQTVSGGILCL